MGALECARCHGEVVTLLGRCHEEAMEILRTNREKLDEIATYLFRKETITGAQMMAILEGRDPDQEEYYGVGPAPAAEALEMPTAGQSTEAEQ